MKTKHSFVIVVLLIGLSIQGPVLQCHEDCQTCDGPGDHDCLTCDICGINSNKIWLYADEKTCTTTCPFGTYAADDEKKECRKCHEDCESCSGPGDHNCLTCDICGITTINAWYYGEERTCTTSCPTGTFIYSYENKECKKCHSDCESCYGAGDRNCITCDKCGVETENTWLYEDEKMCTSSCPPGTYISNEIGKQCSKCHEDCETCSGPGDNNCNTCDPCGVVSLKIWRVQKEKICTTQCPDGTYAADVSNKECLQCHEDCQTCDGPGNNNCLTCDICGITSIKIWLYADEKTCTPTCPFGTYAADDEKKECRKCHEDCESCSGPGDHNCFTCDICGITTENVWYYGEERTCTTSCPTGTFIYSDENKECKKCHSDCESCYGAGSRNCITCDTCGVETESTWFYQDEQTCTSSCPPGTYISNEIGKQCSKCHEDCETCSGSGDHNCDTCDTCGMFSLKLWRSQKQKICTTQCPDGTFAADETNKECLQCHEDCKTCDGPGNHNCLTCDICGIISNKIWLYANDKTCTPTCPFGTYAADDENKLCQKCHSDCESCHGAGDHRCITCDTCGVEAETIWYYENEKTCTDSCPPGTYISDEINKFCFKCHEDCKTCDGPGNHNCLTCDKCGLNSDKIWHYATEKTCSPSCPLGTYASDNENKECRNCITGCTKCDGPNAEDCLDCFQNCLRCPDEHNCTKCFPNFYLYKEVVARANVYEFCLSLSDSTAGKYLFKTDSDGSGISKDCRKNCFSCLSENACIQCKNRNPFGAWIYEKNKLV